MFLENASPSSRLDDFYSSIMLGSKPYSELWQIIKLSLIFSHGNATVESGFSINKNLLVENLQEHGLVAQRTVENAIRFPESIQIVPITQVMLTNGRTAHIRYETHLKESRQNQKEEEKKRTQKRKLSLEIKKLEKRRKVLKVQALEEEEQIT